MVSVELLHQHAIGNVKRMLKFSLKSSDKLCYVKDQRTLDERLLNFKINNDFKRYILPATKYKQWKANQFMQYFFYVAALCLKSLIDKEAYNHYLLFIYIISKLFNPGLDDDDLEFIRTLIYDFINGCKLYYGETLATINIHLLCHLVDNYKKLGPTCNHLAFFFEHLNGEMSKKVTSNNLIQQQILNNSNLEFHYKLLDKKSNDNKLTTIETIGKSFKFDNRDCYSKIEINDKVYSSKMSKESFNKKNCYILAKDDKCYKILYFFKVNNAIFFKCKNIKINDKLYFSHNEIRLELDHIISCRKTENIQSFNCSFIKEKVLFQKPYRTKKSIFLNNKTGYIIRTNYFKFHN